MSLSDDVRDAGGRVIAASGAELPSTLQHFFKQFVGWPYLVAGGRIVDVIGTTTDDLPVVIHASATNPSLGAIPADNVAAVIDAVDGGVVLVGIGGKGEILGTDVVEVNRL